MNEVPRFRNKINFGSYGKEYINCKNHIKIVTWTVQWRNWVLAPGASNYSMRLLTGSMNFNKSVHLISSYWTQK
jgi:hypothetical protein